MRCPRCDEPYALITTHITTNGPDMRQFSIECTGDRTHEVLPALVEELRVLNTQPQL